MVSSILLAEGEGAILQVVIALVVFVGWILSQVIKSVGSAKERKVRDFQPPQGHEQPLWGEEPVDAEPVMAETVPVDWRESGISDDELPITPGQFESNIRQEESITHLPEEVSQDVNTADLDYTDERFAQRIQGNFEHRVGQLDDSDKSATAPATPVPVSSDEAFSAANIAQAMRSTVQVRQAVILGQILQRPESTEW